MREGVILQHAHTGPPGRLGEWATARGIPYRVHRSDEQPPDFDPADHAWIASLGSAHSATDAEPWIAAEVALLGRAVDAGVPVLGLCWGGQALAAALGARVGGAPFPEKGWLEIHSTDPAIPAGPWLHYHQEIFTIPDGAAALGSSPAGPSAFRIGPHLGLQFHPEADAAMAGVWADKDPDQTPQTRARLAAEGAAAEGPARGLAFALFDGWYAAAIRPDAALSA
jgi:GMP synthase-like glutamine amidotransferase